MDVKYAKDKDYISTYLCQASTSDAFSSLYEYTQKSYYDSTAITIF
jgi:hypothetical protein